MPQDIFDAIDAHDLPRLSQLLDAGGDLNAIDERCPFVRPLHAAIVALGEGGSLDAADLLLRHGADIDATYPGVGGGTPLLCALFNNEIATARHLLDKGADPRLPSDEGDSPLRVAIDNGDLVMLDLLLEKGAGKTIESCGPLEGRTALGTAVARLDVRMVQRLLDAGADPAKRGLDRETAEECLPPRTIQTEVLWKEIHALVAKT